ncbi:substrate-binding periplasmic protein [Marinomonas sp. IMCC 4694]|uniref:substrate-binding periplasmic protein n=1 Tax=Marinomonas sp. IMCC 4694 TaxID=2605432 RepID=UPI0011E7E244|nr:transporter substrate-binding domain-containing protein [Marinomonas sp. IMCC 4694]TYL47204.1 transporter substrate-binding domain-containing protein [Marinomonas sp. IMCC 4694]
MRLYLHLIGCLLGLILVLSNTSVAAEKAAVTSSCRALTASGNAEYPPFLWRQKDMVNELMGINRLIIDELSRRIEIPIALTYVGPWSRAQGDVKNGRVDLLAGAFYTNERANYMDYFAPVLLHTTSVVWQSKDKPFVFHQKEDLQGKWGVTVINNSLGQEFDQYAKRNLNILSVASISQALRMLAADRVDYVLYEKNPAYAYASLLGLSDSVVSMSPHLSSEGLYLTMSKRSSCNNPVVKQAIVEALQKMQQEGFTDQAILEGVQAWESQARSDISLN